MSVWNIYSSRNFGKVETSRLSFVCWLCQFSPRKLIFDLCVVTSNVFVYEIFFWTWLERFQLLVMKKGPHVECGNESFSGARMHKKTNHTRVKLEQQGDEEPRRPQKCPIPWNSGSECPGTFCCRFSVFDRWNPLVSSSINCFSSCLSWFWVPVTVWLLVLSFCIVERGDEGALKDERSSATGFSGPRVQNSRSQMIFSESLLLRVSSVLVIVYIVCQIVIERLDFLFVSVILKRWRKKSMRRLSTNRQIGCGRCREAETKGRHWRKK